MKLLAIETCFGKFSLAVFDGANLLAEFISSEENKQAELIIPAIEEILSKANLTYQDLNAIAVCAGPGSFTGVRIGLAAAKGIAIASGLPLIGVSSLDAAATRKGSYPVYLNASRNEAFSQKSADAEPELIKHEGVFDEVGTAADIARFVVKNSIQPNSAEPIYVRKPDAKIPLKNLVDMHKACFDKAWKAEDFANYEIIAEGQRGFVAYQTVLDECEIKTICVVPEYRKQGIATSLMQKLITAEKGKAVFLEVEAGNIPAIKLYEKIGFAAFSTRKNYYGEGRGAVLMKR